MAIYKNHDLRKNPPQYMGPLRASDINADRRAERDYREAWAKHCWRMSRF